MIAKIFTGFSAHIRANPPVIAPFKEGGGTKSTHDAVRVLHVVVRDYTVHFRAHRVFLRVVPALMSWLHRRSAAGPACQPTGFLIFRPGGMNTATGNSMWENPRLPEKNLARKMIVKSTAPTFQLRKRGD